MLECVLDLVDKESRHIEKPVEETINAPEFSLDNENGSVEANEKIGFIAFILALRQLVLSFWRESAGSD